MVCWHTIPLKERYEVERGAGESADSSASPLAAEVVQEGLRDTPLLRRIPFTNGSCKHYVSR